MGIIDDPLWQALGRMQIEPDGAALTFAKRLARENGWSRPHAEAVMEEYRRFLYLAATGSAQVTPSDQVDQAWHLHLAYTRHYWEVLCAQIIGRPLHHGPTAGGGAEGRKYRSLYADTLARYRETFGQEPPVDIWPPSDVRFAGTYQWVDRSRNVIVPRRAVTFGGAAGGAGLLAACTALAAESSGRKSGSALDGLFDLIFGSDSSFFGFFITVFVLIVLFGMLIGRLQRRKPPARQVTRRSQRNVGDSGGVDSGGSSFDDWSTTGSGAAAGGAAFIAGGGDFGGSGADGGWDSSDGDSDSGSDSGGASGGDSGCSSGCGGGCGGD